MILSAVIGKAAPRVFTETSLEVATTTFNIGEIADHLSTLAGKYDLDEADLWTQLSLLPLDIRSEQNYQDHLEEAREHLGERDPDDIHLAALAFAERIPIWSNDRDFEVVPVQVYPTALLLKILGL